LHISEICGIAIADEPKNLQILKNICAAGHLCKFVTGVNNTCGKFLNKFETALTRYSGAWEKLIHEKTRSRKSRGTVPLSKTTILA